MGFTLGLNEVSTVAVAILTFWIAVKLTSWPKNVPPGPWGVPVLGCIPRVVFNGKRVRDTFRDWSYTYGRIYSLKMGSASVVILNDFGSIHEALVRPEFQDRTQMDVTLVAPGSGIVLSAGNVWLEQRKFVHQIFREFGVGKASFEDSIASEAKFLTDALLKLKGKIINIEHVVNNAVSNVICSVAFGKRFDYNDTKFHKILKILNENLQESMIRLSLSVFLPFTKYLPFGGSNKIRDNLKLFIGFHNELTEEHKAKLDPENMKDLMDAYLLEIKKYERKSKTEIFNDDNMMWIISDLFSAGTKTTTTTLLWIFLFFLNNPDIETKVRAQLDEIAGQNRPPRYSDRPNLPLVEAVISETLRLGTASGLSLPHVATRDSELQGYTIPKGTILVPNFYALFTNKEKWDDPEQFRPERFLGKDGRYVKRTDFIPFSAGPRVCLGEQLARMEIFIFLTHIMQKVSFSTSQGKTTPLPVGTDGFTHRPPKFDVLINTLEN